MLGMQHFRSGHSIQHVVLNDRFSQDVCVWVLAKMCASFGQDVCVGAGAPKTTSTCLAGQPHSSCLVSPQTLRCHTKCHQAWSTATAEAQRMIPLACAIKRRTSCRSPLP